MPRSCQYPWVRRRTQEADPPPDLPPSRWEERNGGTRRPDALTPPPCPGGRSGGGSPAETLRHRGNDGDASGRTAKPVNPYPCHRVSLADKQGYRYLQVPLKMARDRTYDRRTEKESPEIGESISRQPAPTFRNQMVPGNHQYHNDRHHDYGSHQPLHPTPEKIAELFVTPDFVDFLFVFNILTFFEPSGFGDAPGIVRMRFQFLGAGLRDFPGIRRGVVPGHESFAFAA